MQLPASASQTLYSRREAEAGSTSNYVISETSNSEMLLNGSAPCFQEALRSRMDGGRQVESYL